MESRRCMVWLDIATEEADLVTRRGSSRMISFELPNGLSCPLDDQDPLRLVYSCFEILERLAFLHLNLLRDYTITSINLFYEIMYHATL